MELQERMFEEVAEWMDSGKKKIEFLEGKPFSEAKFNYWVAKWKADQLNDKIEGFCEVGYSEVKLGKVLEIEAPSGVRITVFA